MCVLAPTGEALTQSSLLEADGEHMTTAVEPMNLHHAMLRSPGSVCTDRPLILPSAPILMSHNYTVSVSDVSARLETKQKTAIRLWASCCYDQACFWLKFTLLLPLCLPPGAADSVVVLSQPDELVTMTTEGHGYGEDVVALL